MTLEELQNKVLELSEENRKLKEDKTSLETKLNEKTKEYDTLKTSTDKRVQELQEHNQKLFLRITHQKEDKKKVNEDFQSKLLGDYAKMLDENELEILRDLEEEL